MTRQWITRMRLLLRLALIAAACVPTIAAGQDVQRITLAGQKAMLANPGVAAVGAAHADVTIVEYFDYNCPYCKQLAPVLRSLLAEDHKIAILYKDWPILGDVSVYAAQSALAARTQGKYPIAYDALMSGARLSKNDEVDTTLQRAGIDMERLKRDRAAHAAEIDALLARNDAEASALDLRGTPGIVIGRQLLPGIVDLSGLRQLVANARHER
jgi:protein-disulfide isomerase